MADERKIVLFYKKGEKDPFWKVRTVDVTRTKIETPALMSPPRCGKGMRVTVDGKPGGTVKTVARIGASTRYLITIRLPRKKKKKPPPLSDDTLTVADEVVKADDAPPADDGSTVTIDDLAANAGIDTPSLNDAVFQTAHETVVVAEAPLPDEDGE